MFYESEIFSFIGIYIYIYVDLKKIYWILKSNKKRYQVDLMQTIKKEYYGTVNG